MASGLQRRKILHLSEKMVIIHIYEGPGYTTLLKLDLKKGDKIGMI